MAENVFISTNIPELYHTDTHKHLPPRIYMIILCTEVHQSCYEISFKGDLYACFFLPNNHSPAQPFTAEMLVVFIFEVKLSKQRILLKTALKTCFISSSSKSLCFLSFCFTFRLLCVDACLSSCLSGSYLWTIDYNN